MDDEEDLDPTAGIGNVPSWVLRLVRDTAETKTTVRSVEQQMQQNRQAMHELSQQMTGFVGRNEFESHQRLVTALIEQRVNPLWDSHNTLIGEQQQRQKTEVRWRYGLGAASVLLALAELLHVFGILR